MRAVTNHTCASASFATMLSSSSRRRRAFRPTVSAENRYNVTPIALGWLTVLLIATTAFAQQPASAQSGVVPPLIKFSGTLTDINNKPISTITGVTFLLYNESHGGSPLWMETQNVQPDQNGHYSVMLGSTTSTGVPAEVFASGQARWLGVKPEGQEEQARVLLVAVPYALKAGDAETIGGLPASAFMRTPEGQAGAASGTASSTANGSTMQPAAPVSKDVIVNSPYGTDGYFPTWIGGHVLATTSQIFQNGSNVGVGTTTPSASLEVNGTGKFDGLVGIGTANTGSFYQLSVLANTNPAAIFAQTGAAGGFFGVGGLSTNTASIGVIGQNMGGGGVPGFDTFNIGVAGQSNNGIGVDGSVESGTGVRGRTYTLTGGYGVYGESFGETSGSTGVYGTANNSTATAATYGVYGTTASTAKGSAGVYGVATGTSSSFLYTYGVYGVSSLQGAGASVAGTGATVSYLGSLYGGGGGVWGDLADSNCCYSVVGTAGNNISVLAINNTGTNTATPTLAASNNTPTTATATVFLAEAPFVGGSCEINAGGDLSCTGTIKPTVAVAGRQLELYSVASPENWFEDFGSSQLSSGSAKIALDPAFASTVNSENYHVFVTPNGECKGLYVASKGAGGFEVRELGNGTSNISFDYRIVAKRRGFENLRMKDVTDQMNGIRDHEARRQARRANAGFTTAPPRPAALEFSPESQPARSARLSPVGPTSKR